MVVIKRNNIIDIIITTSHGRDKNLYYCLKALTLQKFKDFSVIVSDDGSYDNTPKIIKEFKDYFSLIYIWRKNDLKPARSRNLAVKLSKAKFLIFIDSDILLNNKAVLKYNSLLNSNQNISVWGKYGTTDIIEDSEIFKGIKSVKSDRRQFWFEHDEIEGDDPYGNAWSGNFGISRENFLKVGGFNEDFTGWGFEDSEFAWRLFLKKIKIYFNGEVWGEHLPHPHEGKFYDAELLKKNEDIYYKIIGSEKPDEFYNNLLKKCNEELKKNPDNYYVYYNFGVIFSRAKDYEKAKYYYDKCLKINPFFPSAHYNLGLIYLDEKNFEKAFFHLKQTLNFDPNNKKAHLILKKYMNTQQINN